MLHVYLVLHDYFIFENYQWYMLIQDPTIIRTLRVFRCYMVGDLQFQNSYFTYLANVFGQKIDLLSHSQAYSGKTRRILYENMKEEANACLFVLFLFWNFSCWDLWYTKKYSNHGLSWGFMASFWSQSLSILQIE